MLFFFLPYLRRAVSLFALFCLVQHVANGQTSCALTGPDTVCVGAFSEYHIDVSTSGLYTVQWSIPLALIMSYGNEMAVAHWELSGQAQIVATIFNNLSQPVGLCTLEVVIQAVPQPQIIPSFLPLGICAQNGREGLRLEGYCLDHTPVFSAVGFGGVYSWSIDGNTHFSGDFSGASVEVIMDSAGSFTLCLVETNDAGCMGETCISYNIYDLPDVSFEEFTHGTDTLINICKGEDLLFTGDFTDPNNLNFGMWFWEVRRLGVLLGSGFNQTYSHTSNQAGLHTVSLVGSSCMGCTSEPYNIEVNVSDAFGPNIECPSVVCESDQPVLYCATDVCDGYAWFVNGGTVQGDTTSNCIQVIWDIPPPSGYGSVTLTVTDCSDSMLCPLPVTVEVPVIPEATSIQGPTQICNPNLGSIPYSVPYWPGSSYVWSRQLMPGSSGTVSFQSNSGTTSQPLVNLTNFSVEIFDDANVVLPFSAFGDGGQFNVAAEIMFGGGSMFTCDQLIATVNVKQAVQPVTEIIGARQVCIGKKYTYTGNPLLPGSGLLHWTAYNGTPNAIYGTKHNDYLV